MEISRQWKRIYEISLCLFENKNGDRRHSRDDFDFFGKISGNDRCDSFGKFRQSTTTFVGRKTILWKTISIEKRFIGTCTQQKNIEIIHPWNIFSIFIRNSVDSMWSQKFQFLELTKIDDLRERPNLHWRKQKFYLGKSILEKKSVILSVVNLRRKQQSGDNSQKERSGCVTVRFRRNQIG